MINGLMNFAMSMLQNNPNVMNNPFAQEAFKAIQSGDSQKGEMLANNFLQSMGMTKEQALQQAMAQFGMRK